MTGLSHFENGLCRGVEKSSSSMSFVCPQVQVYPLNRFGVAPAQLNTSHRKLPGHPIRHKDTPALFVRLRRTHGSCGHSGTSYTLLCSYWSVLLQRRRNNLLDSISLRLRLHCLVNGYIRIIYWI